MVNSGYRADVIGPAGRADMLLVTMRFVIQVE